AFLEVRREAAAIGDPALRAAVEAMILAPWLPSDAWGYAHLDETRKLLDDARFELPPVKKGDFLAAAGGSCEDGHHGYPGGLAAAQSPEPDRICSWLQAAAIIAEGHKLECPTRQTVEAYIHHFANADLPFTELSWSRYVARAPKGWARYDALREDGNDLLLFSRSP